MHSEQVNELAAALAKAQGQIKAAQKDGKNPHFGSTYATLASVWDACRKPLSENGLSICQVINQGTEGLILETLLFHLSGQWVKSEILASINAGNRGVNEVQALGSTLTYLKRYALSAMVGVVADEDDDGNAAAPSPTQTKRPQPATRPAAPQPVSTPVNAQPPAQPEPANGNGVPNSPQKLLETVNNRVSVTYDNLLHLNKALKQEIGDSWSWPKPDNKEAWQEALEVAIRHARAKEQPEQDPLPLAE